MRAPEPLTTSIPVERAGQRLDRVLADLFPDFSRARIQAWIRDGLVLVEQRVPRPRDKVYGGERVQLTPEAPPDERWRAQDLPLDIVYQDGDIMVVDKPAGLVVHPAVGNRDGTLVNALLHHDPGLAAMPRAGIVHRIDKDTSGLLVVARSLRAHKSLVDQLKRHAVSRRYQAIVNGVLTGGGRVDAPVGRHPVKRTHMAVTASGKPALTHYRVLRRFRAHSHLELELETGRTHQIRVHMAHLRHPLVGDPVYAGRPRIPPACSEALALALRRFPRQALHACRLELSHPADARLMAWDSPLPGDMQDLLRVLDEDARTSP